MIDESVRFLKCGAVLCIISFHSLEDLIVKKRFREHPLLEVVTPRPIMASADEVAVNPRARSARLRVACRRSNSE
ncbi:16S rRNA (cytosine(1402)-N(4))-methyltransferase [candidate division KSB3 bacterium]|nr:MAG: 16S rRNA (cytosine(1402)-N(4))-methyltransferase [candidate division KSB3 bacterium]